MRRSFWWVNHTCSARHEIEGSYLWFPSSTRKSKARSESEKNIQRVLPGDVIFSFADGVVGAVGVALGASREAAKPSELASIADYADVVTGCLVPVRFISLAQPLRTEERMADLSPVLPRKHSPLLSSGASNQHVVLAAVPALLEETLRGLLAGEVERIVGTILESVGRSLAEDAVEAAVQQRTDISAAVRADLLKARYGQGPFRANLEHNEHSCRLTGVLDRRHLWARHIKPWSECDDAEKLDGNNGLLMSPHIGHLFERGYVSFSDEGDLLVSQELNPVVLANWHIRLPLNVGQFKPEQCYFLDYHRREVFQQHGAGRRQKAAESDDPLPFELPAEPATVQPA
jgi:putative restriction endonuclease